MNASNSRQMEQLELTYNELRFANYYLGEAQFNATDAAIFGVTRETIFAIQNNRNWKHI